MFRFAEPTYLYLLALVPLLALVRYALQHRQKRKLRLFGEPALLKQLMPDVSRWRPEIKFWLLEGVLALFILMLARPQMGAKISQEKRVGIETIIAMDISNSMLAQDVEPSRLDRSKMMVENLVDNFTDDKIGLIVFAGDAFVQLPITSDYVSAKMFLGDINPSMIATQGTDLARAITMATHSFTPNEGIGKAIIVITDGEDHEGGAVEAAKEAKSKGMRVYVLGVGSPNGAPIPVPGTGDYMRDNAGNTVMSGLNEAMCQQVAEAGGGAYIHVGNNSNAQDQLSSELDKLARKETASSVYSEYDEQFQAIALIALLLLIIETCLLDRKNPLMKHVTLFSKRKRVTTIVALLVVASGVASAQTDRSLVRQGNKQFRGGIYNEAEVSYRKALEANPSNAQAEYNLGNAAMAQGKDSSAVESLQRAAQLERNPIRRSQSYHNIGWMCQKRQMYAEAIEAYKDALRNNPADDETRYNLALCKRMLKEQQQNQQGQQQDQNGEKDKQEQQQQQQQDKQQQQQQQEQPTSDKMNKETAEQLLNAAVQQEKDTQERMKKAMQQAGKRKLEKNW